MKLLNNLIDYSLLEAISKPCLRPDGCVAGFLEMRTTYCVCSAFSSTCALLSNRIQSFETASSKKRLGYCQAI